MIKKILLWPGTQIALLCTAFFIFVANSADMFGFSGDLFIKGDIWRIFTFPFTHINFNHLIENMIALGIVSLLACETKISKKEFVWVFLGANVLIALTDIVFLPAAVIAGASAGIFAMIGGIALKGSEFISQWVFFPLMLSSVFIKEIVSLLTNNSINMTYLLFHVLGLVYGLGIFFYLSRYRLNRRRILETE
jgi:membrane associated rhomboid family serine protease